MSDAKAKLATLGSLCKDAELWDDGAQVLVFLPGLKVHSDGKVHVVDALLCPRARDNYPTRLFLSKPFTGKAANWNAFNIKGRTWHACSWTGVPESLSWLQILANHLSPLR